MNEDFKLEYLFNKYKDYNINSFGKLKGMLKENKDDYIDPVELFNKIINYYIKKYGVTMENSTYFKYADYCDRQKIGLYWIKKLGTSEERRERKWKYDKKVKENNV